MQNVVKKQRICKSRLPVVFSRICLNELQSVSFGKQHKCIHRSFRFISHFLRFPCWRCRRRKKECWRRRRFFYCWKTKPEIIDLLWSLQNLFVKTSVRNIQIKSKQCKMLNLIQWPSMYHSIHSFKIIPRSKCSGHFTQHPTITV